MGMEHVQGDEREYEAVLEGFKTAILVTRGADGHFRSRPMELQEKRHLEAIWFATEDGSEKCRDIAADPHVALAFHSGEHDPAYLSISGRAEIVRDRQKIHELWDASWKPWFPDGPDQADLVLIRVVPEHVEWVKPEGGRAQVVKTMVKRAVTGSREEPAPKKELDLH